MVGWGQSGFVGYLLRYLFSFADRSCMYMEERGSFIHTILRHELSHASSSSSSRIYLSLSSLSCILSGHH